MTPLRSPKDALDEHASLPSTARAVVLRLAHQGTSVAVAESCTGGLLSGAITSVPGSSAVFRGGIVAYGDDVKLRLLGVGATVLRRKGAVSRECAVGMAKGAKAALGADIGLAVTGIAGPGGAVPGKPVGTVWIALAGPSSVRAVRHRFKGNRLQVRRASVRAALALLAGSLE